MSIQEAGSPRIMWSFPGAIDINGLGKNNTDVCVSYEICFMKVDILQACLMKVFVVCFSAICLAMWCHLLQDR